MDVAEIGTRENRAGRIRDLAVLDARKSRTGRIRTIGGMTFSVRFRLATPEQLRAP